MTVFVVTGAPGSGKSTWIDQRRAEHDVIVDYDALAQAVCPGIAKALDAQPQFVRRVVREARAAAVECALSHDDGSCDVFIVHAFPRPWAADRYRRAGARIVAMSTSADECARRLAERVAEAS